MAKKVAIVQSCYIPWKGYFDLIRSVDEFILYDHVQYTKRDWRNRNQIKTPNQTTWLTIPIKVKGKFAQSILECEVSNHEWPDNHWETIFYNYKKAPYFKAYGERLKQLYLENKNELSLSKINFNFITAICDMLDIKTRINWSKPLKKDIDKTEQLIYQCQAVDATHYLSGPLAKNYIDTEKFRQANIHLEYFEYPEYKTYPQLFGDFIHSVSILDLLFNTGPEALTFISGNDK